MMLKLEEYLFDACVAKGKNTLAVSIRSIEDNEEGYANSTFLIYHEGKWYGSGDTIWTTYGMCVVSKPDAKTIAVGCDGNAAAMTRGVATEELMEEAFAIRDVVSIGGYAYACGMHRQVFKRIDNGKWIPMHAPEDDTIDSAYGFKAIDGFSESDIYAVGWLGEIWHYDGKKWRQIDSPVNEDLNAVVCAGDGRVYACGSDVVVGRGDEWSVINKEGYQSPFGNSFWGIEWFNGKLYVVDLWRVCVLEGDDLRPVDMGDVYPGSCYHLTSSEGTMWSVGERNVFSFDGETWTRIE